jgi:hypothetical protein
MGIIFMKSAFRWVLLGLPTGLLLALVLYVSRPEAAPGVYRSKKVSDEALPEKDPVAFLEKCLKHYDRTVKGYRTVFHKQERIGGRLNKPEEIRVSFREKPYSVFFEWLKGKGLVDRALYVAGENNGKMLVRPVIRLFKKYREVDPEGTYARRAGRYTIKEFGLRKGTERTLDSWKKARARGALHLKYLGVFTVDELGGRECYQFRRTPYDPPEDDGITDLTIFIDKKNLLQVGSILRGKKGRIASYFFKDLRLNPKFKPDQFTVAALIR